MPDDLPIEYDLLKDVVALNLKVLDTNIEHFEDNTHVKIVMKDVDPEAEPDEDDDSNVIGSHLRARCPLVRRCSAARCLGHALHRDGRVAGRRHAPPPSF